MNYSWEIDTFDTDVFGFNVAKIHNIDSEEYLKDLILDFTTEKIKYATYRIEANSLKLILAMQRYGFVLVDGIIALETESYQGKIDEHVREASSKDLEALKKITLGLFLLSRVYNDPLISNKSGDEFFLRWVENSVKRNAADSVLVWEEDKKILGYITLQKKGQIPLIGVSKEARGKGIGKKMVFSSFAKFSEWKVNKIRIETQISNIPALRMDLDCGFKPVNSYLTLRWANIDS